MFGVSEAEEVRLGAEGCLYKDGTRSRTGIWRSRNRPSPRPLGP